MNHLPKGLYKKLSQKGYTLLEIIVVLAIIGASFSLVVYGVIRFRQVILTSNTAKEVALQLRKARRFAINNAVTSDGYPTGGYYIFIDESSGTYEWGECGDSGCRSSTKVVKSEKYNGVDVSTCQGSSGDFSVIKFENVTGEFSFYEDKAELLNNNSTEGVTCTIQVKIPGVLNSVREVEVSGGSRTIRIL
jgi:prepilin-type N-terminal cleavage/methylation domain-containing protein